MSHVIALCGHQGAGKDFVATFLKGLGFEQVAFADKLREETKAKYGFKDEHFLHPLKDTYVKDGLTPREAMKLIAQERRKEDDNYFVKDVMNKIKDKDLVVISDLRFPTEVEYLRTLPSVTIIKLERKGSVNDGYADKIKEDYLINNDDYYHTYQSLSEVLSKMLNHKGTFVNIYNNIFIGKYALAIYLLFIGQYTSSALQYLYKVNENRVRDNVFRQRLQECLEKRMKL